MKVITTWVNPIFYLSIAVSLCLWEPGRAMSQSMERKSAGCDLRHYTEKTDPNSSPQDLSELNQFTLSPAEIEAAARKITVRVSSAQSGGSGVLIGKRTLQGATTYLVVTNRHVVGRDKQFHIQTPDGKKQAATIVSNSSIDPNYDLALLQFTSNQKYDLAQIQDVNPIEEKHLICSIGFPFDSDRLRLSKARVSQLLDAPFQDGTQLGYEIDRTSASLRQGMSGGPIMNHQGQVIGINTLGSQPILPKYIYFDGRQPTAQQVDKYRQANWGIPIYNFLTQLNADILYNYDNFPKVQRQVTPTGYMARMNRETRQKTVRIETGGSNGSGVIIAKEGATYYVLTAKHVVEKQANIKAIAHDQESYTISPNNISLAKGVDLAVVKFTGNTNYPIAQIGEYSPIRSANVFVGGYPSRDGIGSPLWQWQLNPGKIHEKEHGKLLTQDKQSFSNGYDLLYSSLSYGGMSGGPVLDTDGKVIGIHGKAEGDGSKKVILGYSAGISTQSFVGIASKLKVNTRLLSISKQLPADLKKTDLETVEIVRDNIAQPPENSSSQQWLQYGNQLHRIGKYIEAAAAFDKAITKGEKLLGNYGKALALWYSHNNNERALRAINTAIAAVPEKEKRNYYYLWKYQSNILRNLGRYTAGLKAIEVAIKLEPEDLLLLDEKAKLLSKDKKYSQAIAVYDEIVRQQPAAYAYINRSIAKSALGDGQGASLDIDLAVEINPNLALAYYNRGKFKYDLGDYRGAMLEVDRAIQLDPTFAPSYNNRGKVKSLLGNQREAILDFDLAIQLNPNDAEAYNNRGKVKSLLGNQREAILDLDRAIQLDPTFVLAYNNRALAKYELGDRQGAILDYDRALQLNPNYAEAYNNRGNVKSELGDKRGSILDFDRALELNPNYTLAYNNRGLAKSDLGDKQEAIADLTKAAKLFRQQGQMNLYKQAIEKIQQLTNK